MENHKNHMFLKPLKAQTMWKTLEMIIAKRMQNMGKSKTRTLFLWPKCILTFFCIRWKIMGGEWKSIFHPPQRGIRRTT